MQPKRLTEEHASKVIKGLVGLTLPIKINISDDDFEVRSERSHNHQFAEINEMFENLPENHADQLYAANAASFRKHGLIMEGFCDVYGIVCASKEEAMKAAPKVASAERKAHGYALISVKDAVIVVKAPHSQSLKEMGKDKFQESKQRVLEWARDFVGVTA